MKKHIIGLCALLLTVGIAKTEAQTEELQDIIVKDFRYVNTDVTARVNPVYDNNGEACAVIKLSVRDTSFVIEPNLGCLKRECMVGEIRLWVPSGTKRLTVRYPGLLPLRDYVIPVQIESRCGYHAIIIANEVVRPPKETPRIEPPIANDDNKRMSDKDKSQIRFFLAPNFLITPKPGLSLTLGVNVNNHIIEAGATFALSKSDSLYYYGESGWEATYRHQLLKATMRYGYEYRTKGDVAFSYTPLFGVHGNFSFGSGYHNEAVENGKNGVYKDGMALSVSAAIRLSLCVGEHFAWYAMPEYSIASFKSDSYKMMMRGNDVFKKWAEGFSLSTGLVVTF